jgi:nickel-dependent lactate racemase
MNQQMSRAGVGTTMVTLFRKKGNLEVNLPKNWELLQTLYKEDRKVRRPLADLIESALDHPVDSRPLEEMLKPGSHVAIVVDDGTRPTPVRGLLPPLLNRIHQCGVPEKDVDIVIGVGTHRPLSQKEIEQRCGKEVVKAYRIQNHNARSGDQDGRGSRLWIGLDECHCDEGRFKSYLRIDSPSRSQWIWWGSQRRDARYL